MLGLGIPELVLLLALGFLLFGSHLPALARSLGKTVVEVRRGVADLAEEVRP